MLESNSGAPADAMDGAARIALLEGELELLRRRDVERTAELAARERRIRLLEEALRILTADRYGASREKLHVAPGQTELFNEAEALVELNEVLGTEVNLKATPQRENKADRGRKPGRKAIAAHLPRVPVVHDIPESERQCACGTMLIEIGSDISEQLDYVPPKIQVCSMCARSTLARDASTACRQHRCRDRSCRERTRRRGCWPIWSPVNTLMRCRSIARKRSSHAMGSAAAGHPGRLDHCARRTSPAADQLDG
jgi:hypothetical protein